MVASSLRSNVIVWVINIMNSCQRYLSTKCQVSDSLVCTDIDNSLLVYLMMNVINWIELKKRGQMSRRLINRGVSVIVDVLFFTLFFNDAITKALNTCGNCQRPLFSLSLSQHLWKFGLNCSSKLQENNDRKTPLKHIYVCFRCIIWLIKSFNLTSFSKTVLL